MRDFSRQIPIKADAKKKSKAKKQSSSRLLISLGIKHVGVEISELLLVKYKSLSSIINISSIDALRAGGSKNVPYSVAKAGVSHLTRLMAVHHGREKIRVNCLAPGHVHGSFPNSINHS